MIDRNLPIAALISIFVALTNSVRPRWLSWVFYWYNLAEHYFFSNAAIMDQTNEKQSSEQKVNELRQAAEQGDAAAQYTLGRLYELGRGVPKDEAKAAHWYRKAAEQGHMEAQYSFGLSYHKGIGVPQYHAEAAKWYRKAAEQGHAEAQYNLGMRYAYIQGYCDDVVCADDICDDVQAVKWLRKAAEQGHADAQFYLGVKYHCGFEGTPEDEAEATKWYQKAAEQGHEHAIDSLKAIEMERKQMEQ